MHPRSGVRHLTNMDLGDVDVVVAGAGPAGALLAPALCRRGLRVLLVDPQGLQSSPKTLCDFRDHLDPMVVGSTAETVTLRGAGQTTHLPPYSQIRSPRISAAAAACVDDGQLSFRKAAVREPVATKDGGLEIRLWSSLNGHGLDVDDVVHARALIDASGHGSDLVQRRQGPRRRLAWQTAFGIRIRGKDPALDAGEVLFMDWSAAVGDVVDGHRHVPSFLYAIPFDDGSILLEETVLAARPAVPLDVLEARLMARLKVRGTVVAELIETERVAIPMDLPLPRGGQAVAAFGAAAGLVHPTTGFQVARTMAHVEEVADAVAGSIQHGAVAVADAVLHTLWTPERRAQRDLQCFCLEAALRLRTNDDAGRFFHRFFGLDDAMAWLGGSLSAAGTRRAMWQLFGEASWADRALLLRGGLSRQAIPVLSGLAGAAFTSKTDITPSPRPGLSNLSAGVSP